MASGLNQSSDSDLMWGLRNAVESCNDVTKEDLYSDKFVDLLVNDSHVGHVRPDFARALLEHGSLNDDDGYVLFSRSGNNTICLDRENRYKSAEEKTRVVAELFEKMLPLRISEI